ncbi:MAG: transporter substrate-binding domain-containing protein [Campylobacter sp.]|nr:transporter substrate-binding domain-containing protein [Campylobacter sp.]
MLKKLFLCFVLGVFCCANSLQEIQTSKTIRIGLHPDIPPFSQLVNNEFEGFEVEFAKRLGKELVGDGGKVEFIAINAEDRIKSLQDNQVDIVIQAFTKTAERAKQVDFSMPYFSTAVGILVNKDSNIKNTKDLSGKKVAVEKGITAEQVLKQYPDIEIVYVEGSNHGYRALKEGKVDGLADDNIIVLAYPIIDDTVEVPEYLLNLGSSDYMSAAVAKNNTELKQAIDKYMITLSKEQFFKKIYDDNFGIFYRNTLNPNQFLLENIYRIYGLYEFLPFENMQNAKNLAMNY